MSDESEDGGGCIVILVLGLAIWLLVTVSSIENSLSRIATALETRIAATSGYIPAKE